MTKNLPKTRQELQVEAGHLHAVLEGISVLRDAADGEQKDEEARRAGNALLVLIEVAIEKAHRLDIALDNVNKPELAA
ncbi:MAG: hypothetical protein AAGJ91_07660 [Pseudomonadota bacterium]